MGSESNRIPEEYVDMLVQEFAYDPIRLPLAEDPAQVLYNHTTAGHWRLFGMPNTMLLTHLPASLSILAMQFPSLGSGNRCINTYSTTPAQP